MPGGISKAGTIPTTTRDAMQLTKQLGIRYLWVDALCIVQGGDERSKEFQLNMMGAIYNCATLTIIAAVGRDANAGLSGYTGSRPRGWAQNVIAFLPGKPNLQLDPIDIRNRNYNTTSWHGRAWTFQEKAFSRRVLIFGKTIQWACREASWTEEIAMSSEYIHRVEHNEQEVILAQEPRTQPMPVWAEPDKYAFAVVAYNNRKLSFDGDALRAFAGYIGSRHGLFYGGFYQGLPELFFHQSLLWQPRSVLRPRVPRHEEPVGLPSWSWIAWEGELDTDLWRYASDWVVGSADNLLPRMELTPVAEISIASMLDKQLGSLAVAGKSCSAYRGQYSKTRLRNSDAAKEDIALPAGWTRRRDLPDIFMHESLAAKSYPFAFRYPLPIVNSTPIDPPVHSSNFLVLRTTRCVFHVSERLATSKATHETSIVDEHADWAGIMRHSLPRDLPISPKGECELIALSLGIVAEENLVDFPGNTSPLSERFADRPKRHDTGLYEFYNVIWIVSRDGIAYRRALGRVIKDIWDNHPSQTEVEITLG